MKMVHAISALALSAVAASAQALPASLTFDGFCDGLSGISSTGNIVTATWDLSACGLTSTAAVGKSGGKSVSGLYDVATQGLGVASFLTVVNEDGTWAYVGFDGALLNSGTWTAGAANLVARPQRLSSDR